MICISLTFHTDVVITGAREENQNYLAFGVEAIVLVSAPHPILITALMAYGLVTCSTSRSWNVLPSI